ncbi:MAG: hypothetical protein E4H01_11395 [Lysobacterales bacterium]|nr:MAG: hypothetical protein E4H01_11395 [Xanthomonadales bacterium]
MAALLLLLCSASAAAEDIKANELLTRDEAIGIAYDVIVPASLDHAVTAFMGMAPLDAGDTIVPVFTEGRQYTIDGPTWFCWIDDNPQAFFEHDTRYVFINAVTGAVSVVVEKFWPVLNGEPLFMTDEEWTDLEIVIYSCIHSEEVGGDP